MKSIIEHINEQLISEAFSDERLSKVKAYFDKVFTKKLIEAACDESSNELGKFITASNKFIVDLFSEFKEIDRITNGGIISVIDVKGSAKRIKYVEDGFGGGNYDHNDPLNDSMSVETFNLLKEYAKLRSNYTKGVQWTGA